MSHTIEKFFPLRDHLLALHRALLTFEKHQYEGVYGRIASNGDYLTIVMNHASFKWLRQLSELIVQVDEMIHTKEPWHQDKIGSLLNAIQMLLVPNEMGSEFSQKYHVATQKSPEAAMMHGQVMIELKKLV